MTAQTVAPIGAFISYSWSSATHEQWVLELATRLVEDGIDVRLDKWELQPGRDANAFMEQMVTKPEVRKVLMICDRIYKEKADGREGGVGKEAQILTAEIYEKAAVDKYAALITEKDDNGKPYVPAYYSSRQYIDFTDKVKSEEKYQELLRWMYDKPQHVKPKLGAAPSFIVDPEAANTSTTSKLKQAEHAIKTSSTAAGGAIIDFGEALVEELSSLRATSVDGEPWDETVIKAAASMRPGIRNLGELIVTEARFGGGNFPRIVRIFEQIGSLMYAPPGVRGLSGEDFDPYKMICYEAFTSMTAILLMEERFDLLQVALRHPYLISRRERQNGSATVSYRVFNQEVESFRRRKNRLASNQIDLYADLLGETYRVSFPNFEQFIEADLVLFLRSQIVPDGSETEPWWPRTLIYAEGFGCSSLFARSESWEYFANWSSFILNSFNPSDFKTRVSEMQEYFKGSWGGRPFGPNIFTLTNAAHIGKRS
jgi:hypothetical protein